MFMPTEFVQISLVSSNPLIPLKLLVFHPSTRMRMSLGAAKNGKGGGGEDILLFGDFWTLCYLERILTGVVWRWGDDGDYG